MIWTRILTQKHQWQALNTLKADSRKKAGSVTLTGLRDVSDRGRLVVKKHQSRGFSEQLREQINPAEEAQNHKTKTIKNKAVKNTIEAIEYGGQKGPDPTRYGDWEKAGRCTDF